MCCYFLLAVTDKGCDERPPFGSQLLQDELHGIRFNSGETQPPPPRRLADFPQRPILKSRRRMMICAILRSTCRGFL